jgi:ubiquinone/menaquinone biosynthesis C-methylase UbiE
VNRAQSKNNIKFDKVAAANLPYQDRGYDIVVLYCALHNNDREEREGII